MAPKHKPKPDRRRTYFREWRKWRGQYSMNEAARLIGYDHSTLQRIETGQTPYCQDKLEKLSRLYGITLPDWQYRDPEGIRNLPAPLFGEWQRAPAEKQRQALAAVRKILSDKEVEGA